MVKHNCFPSFVSLSKSVCPSIHLASVCVSFCLILSDLSHFLDVRSRMCRETQTRHNTGQREEASGLRMGRRKACSGEQGWAVKRPALVASRLIYRMTGKIAWSQILTRRFRLWNHSLRTRQHQSVTVFPTLCA